MRKGKNTKTDWQIFFDNHAPFYMDNCFTKDSEKEVDFIIREMDLKAGMKILDIGCGTGRHSVALARHGLEVTGLDLSRGMLEQAMEYANKSGTAVKFVQHDASDLSFIAEFDAAVCLCEGAFGLLNRADDPETHTISILSGINRSLKPQGMFLLNALNAFRKIREFQDSDITKGVFCPFHTSVLEVMEFSENGRPKKITVMEKAYTPAELRLYLEKCGFQVVHIWGGTAGHWKKAPPKLTEMELLVLSQKITRLA